MPAHHSVRLHSDQRVAEAASSPMPGPTGAFIIYSLTVWFLITSFRLDISEEKDWMIGTKYKQLFISNKHKQFDWRSFQLQASRAITLKMRDFSFASVS